MICLLIYIENNQYKRNDRRYFSLKKIPSVYLHYDGIIKIWKLTSVVICEMHGSRKNETETLNPWHSIEMDQTK